jgi:hypothetical protein
MNREAGGNIQLLRTLLEVKCRKHKEWRRLKINDTDYFYVCFSPLCAGKVNW